MSKSQNASRTKEAIMLLNGLDDFDFHGFVDNVLSSERGYVELASGSDLGYATLCFYYRTISIAIITKFIDQYSSSRHTPIIQTIYHQVLDEFVRTIVPEEGDSTSYEVGVLKEVLELNLSLNVVADLVTLAISKAIRERDAGYSYTYYNFNISDYSYNFQEDKLLETMQVGENDDPLYAKFEQI